MKPDFFNLSKRKKRDIFSELLLGKPSGGIIGKKELNAVNRLLAGMLAGMLAGKARIRINGQLAKTQNVTFAKKKIPSIQKNKTHYLSFYNNSNIWRL